MVAADFVASVAERLFLVVFLFISIMYIFLLVVAINLTWLFTNLLVHHRITATFSGDKMQSIRSFVWYDMDGALATG